MQLLVVVTSPIAPSCCSTVLHQAHQGSAGARIMGYATEKQAMAARFARNEEMQTKKAQ